MLASRRIPFLAVALSLAFLLGSLTAPHSAREKLATYASEVSKTSLSQWAARLETVGGCDACKRSQELCSLYGSRALQKSRVYGGSGDRTQRILRKAAEGKGISFAAIGGSVTLGMHTNGSLYHEVVYDWIQKYFPNPLNKHTKAGVGARGSSYFKFCHATLIPQDVDIILLETAINDWQMGDTSFNNMETLLRSLLDYPSKPLVIMVQSFKIDSWLATGGDSSLGLANYYDIPTISTRPVFLPAILKDDSLAWEYYTHIKNRKDGKDFERLDYVHPGTLGHKAMGDFVVAYLEEQRCKMLRREPPIFPTSPMKSLDPTVEDGLTLPRQRLRDRYQIGFKEDPIHSTCITLDNKDTANKLQPTQNKGWDLWTMPHTDGRKRFWRAQKPGDSITFEITTIVGEITLYALRSRQHDLGIVKCWVDDDIEHVTMLGGWEDIPYTIGSDFKLETGVLAPGKHDVHCEAIQHTSNPDPNAHIFLLIGIFAV